MPENNLKDILEKCLINKIDHYKRTCFQLALFFDYIGSNGKSVCLKCQRKKMTTQRGLLATKVLLYKVPFKIKLNTKECREDYIEQKGLTL